MTPELKDFLKTKLVDTCLHLQQTELDKKESNAGFSEEIKGSKERIKALSESINSGSVEALAHAYGHEYIEMIEQEANK